MNEGIAVGSVSNKFFRMPSPSVLPISAGYSSTRRVYAYRKERPSLTAFLRTSCYNSFFARVALTESDGQTETMVVIPLTCEAICPHFPKQAQ